jgi:hypothetical protein
MTMRRNASIALCNELYERPDGNRLYCQYLQGHMARVKSAETDRFHSWAAIADEDERANRLPPAVVVFRDNLAAGEYDTHIELCLTLLHNHKRAMRSTPGFTREDT